MIFYRAWVVWVWPISSSTSVCCCGVVCCSSSLSAACVQRTCPWWWWCSRSPANCCSESTSEPEVRGHATHTRFTFTLQRFTVTQTPVKQCVYIIPLRWSLFGVFVWDRFVQLSWLLKILYIMIFFVAILSANQIHFMTVFQLQQNYFFIFVLKLDFHFAVRSLAVV